MAAGASRAPGAIARTFMLHAYTEGGALSVIGTAGKLRPLTSNAVTVLPTSARLRQQRPQRNMSKMMARRRGLRKPSAEFIES